MKKIFLSVLALSFLVFSCQKENELAVNDQTSPEEAIIDGQYIVVFNQTSFKSFSTETYEKRMSVVREEAKVMLTKHNIAENVVRNTYGTVLRGFCANLTKSEVEELRNDASVKYIVEDKIFTLGIVKITGKPVPVPPAETIPYGILRVGYGSGIGKTAWIIDTGVDLDHPDLTVDASRGYDFINNDAFADDDNGHGSHCAGTVAAKDNDIGVVGVAAGATIVPVKVLDRRGSGAYSVIIAGVDFVATNAQPGDAANMSLGGGVYEPIDEAVYNASQKGIYFALAAGNESDDANNHSPARVNGPNIWTISAMDVNDNWAYFSNYGNPPIEYCMPGVNIFSTYKSGGFTTMSGTSMAAPHMCGVLLMTNGNPSTDGYVNGDPDGNPDPIAHL
ncbi:MAG: S8 family peptidase [Bacteroidales bacterium]|nr:S8 family peptidase [Bacteroidales bacterium]